MAKIRANEFDEQLLDEPWGHDQRSWNAQALQQAKQLLQQWERHYPDHQKRVRHHNPEQEPNIPTFQKVDDELVAPMIALGGKTF